MAENNDLESNPFWYKDAVIYQVHVKSFFDANGDGYGDFAGLIEKLDYIKDLGVTCIWLLPFYPSPLRDDGYDIADYTAVNNLYGSMTDFRNFLELAHKAGLRVITELVINHTSDQHPWFQAARRAPAGSRKRDWYVWTDDEYKYKDARIIFLDTEKSNWTWDELAQSFYWHRFFSHQPDLNFDNPSVLKALVRVMRYWLDIGVDGLRLDAIPYLVERDGTSCENLPETHAVLKLLRKELDRKYKDRIFIAEANQWPQDVRQYFGNSDECHMAFHFPIMPRLYLAVHQENNSSLIEVLKQTPPIPDDCQWAIFLRNHDELTLEMVTEVEREYMYKAYAPEMRMRCNLGIRRRLAPLMDFSRRRIELMNGLLFSLPGTPIVYYGDEIGMGDNIWLSDRNGVRTPMQWTSGFNSGFSNAPANALYAPIISDPISGFQAVNVESQLNNPSSLLNWMSKIITLRKNHLEFGRGSFEIVETSNNKTFAYLRKYQQSSILVVANLSQYPQVCSLKLEGYAGTFPRNLFGGTRFHQMSKEPYTITLGAYDFYWLHLTDSSQMSFEPADSTRAIKRLQSEMISHAQ
jgi:maltose alpha-D-glucosyltransferase/alpha-amylase